MMRAMLLEFPEDPGCDYLDRQYMLGDSLLVAPVFSTEGIVDYYLPEGKWTNWFTNEIISGGRWIKERHNYFSLPLMVRPNALLAVGAWEDKPDYDFAEDVVLHLFQLEDEAETTCQVYSQRGHLELAVSVSRSGKEYIVQGQAEKPWKLHMRGIEGPVVVEGGSAASTPLGQLVSLFNSNGKITVEGR